MVIHNPILTGSFTVNNIDVSSITSSAANITALNATTASLNASTASLNTFSASVLTFTGSVNTFTGSASTRLGALEAATASLYTATSSFSGRVGALESYTASQTLRNATYATTGSNTFIGSQVISGSLTTSGSITSTSTITAQTLVVQTITSSVVYSSGSNVFGNVIGNTQTFTGSVLVTGSLTIAGASSATSYSGATIYGSTAVCSPVGLFSGCVGIGKTPVFPLDVCGFAGDTITAKFARGGSECNFYISSTNNEYVNLATEGSLRFKVGITTNCPYSSGTSAMIITSAGNVLLNNTFGGAQMVIADSAKSGNGTPLIISSTDASNQMQLVFGRVTNCYFSIQSVEQNIGYRNLILQSNGGNVGINTTTPTNLLHIEASNNTTNQFRVNSCDGLNAGVRSYTTCDGPGLLINHYYAVGGSPYLRTSDFVSNQGDGASTQMRFFTKDFNANPALAMIITSGRSVGIGTDTPSLHSNSSGLVVKGIGARGIIEVWDGTCGKGVFQQVGGTTYIGNLDKGTSGGSLRLLVNGDGGAATEAMVITCAGRVLINNSAQNGCADYSRMTISGAYAKTNNCTGYLGSVLHLTSCENDYPFGVKFAIYGDTCSTSRYVGIQTGDHNISNQGNIVFQPSGGRVGIGNSLPSYGLDVCGTVRLTNGSTAQNVIISSTNAGATATTLQISNSSNTAYNDGVKMVQGGGTLRFHDLNDTALLGFDLTNTRVGVLTTAPGRALDVNGDSTLRGNNYINSSKMIQWEGGAYWSWRSVTSATEFQAYRGDTGAVPFLINNSNTIKLNGSFENNATVGTSTYTLDTMNGYQSIANGGYVDFSGMSGVLFVNNWSNGGVTIWLLGGGNTVALGSVIAQVGTAHHNPGVGGYRWCQNYGSTANFGFQIFRTRNTA